MNEFASSEGLTIVGRLITTIQENKQYLSEIDGAIGDGDHGINMNKGFTMCQDELSQKSGDFSFCLSTLSRVLMSDIGGSMGPLYGMFFRAMATTCKGAVSISAPLFGEMLAAAQKGVQTIGNAQVGDKTLLDTLVPAVNAFKESVACGETFKCALQKMESAAIAGRDSTKDMVAKVGRASRLGERSRGVLDAGATSCCLILVSMARSIITLLDE